MNEYDDIKSYDNVKNYNLEKRGSIKDEISEMMKKKKENNKKSNTNNNYDLESLEYYDIDKEEKIKIIDNIRSLIYMQNIIRKFLALKKLKILRKEKEKEDSLREKDKDKANKTNDGIEIKTISKKSLFKYLGGIKNEKKEGFGIEKWSNNAKYTGFYKDDLYNGYGKLRKKNGDCLKGK